MPAGGVVGARKPGVRLSETGGTFARSFPCGVETVIAFAGEKWVFLVRFSVAEVSLVSTSPRGCVLCAKKFAPRGLMWVRARKSSPSALKTPQFWCFWACWANFFAEGPLEGQCWANYFADRPKGGSCWASFSRKCRREAVLGELVVPRSKAHPGT